MYFILFLSFLFFYTRLSLFECTAFSQIAKAHLADLPGSIQPSCQGECGVGVQSPTSSPYLLLTYISTNFQNPGTYIIFNHRPRRDSALTWRGHFSLRESHNLPYPLRRYSTIATLKIISDRRFRGGLVVIVVLARSWGQFEFRDLWGFADVAFYAKAASCGVDSRSPWCRP